MVTDRASHLLDSIHQHYELQLALKEYLSKANSLLQVSLDQEFLTHPPTTIYGYLWALEDFIERSRDINEEALSLLQTVLPVADITQNSESE